MGGLFGKFFRKREFRVLMNGLDAAGKRTILYRLKLAGVVTTFPTIAFNAETVERMYVEPVTWDVGGRGTMRPLYRHYYSGTNPLVYVVDSNDRDRIEDARKELHNIVKEELPKDVIVVVLANKQDLDGALTPSEIQEKMDVNTICKTHTCEVFGTVATSGEGLNEMLDWLVDATSRKQAGEILRGKDEFTTMKKESKLSYFTSPFPYIKQIFSRV